jgi:hypothetical protein
MALSDLFEKNQMFQALCQEPKCRARLGGMHMPCVGGGVVLICHRCGTVSAFQNMRFGIRPSVVMKLRPDELEKIGGKLVGASR